MYFIANWKMFGGLNTLNSLKKVIKFLKIFKKSNNTKIVYCPPSTLILPMSKNMSCDVFAHNTDSQPTWAPMPRAAAARSMHAMACT